MAYIGKTPTVGNFQVCDAISVVNNQAAYTMQVGTVNVSPESANHMIVSLNGVIQKPTDAFTVSGSTITFASNLVTGDVINFIQILGNVLDLGVPSDNTVTTAKLSSTSVTAAKLNNDIITGQTAETSIADGDTILIHDASASALRKMTKANFVSGIGGAYTLAQFTSNNPSSQTHAGAAHKAYNFGTAITTTPSASTDLIELTLNLSIEGTLNGYYGLAFGVNTSDSWGDATNDSRLKVNSGEYSIGIGAGHDSERYKRTSLIGTYTLTQLGMSAGTQYYIKPHILSHDPSGQIITAVSTTSSNGAGRGNFYLKRWTA